MKTSKANSFAELLPWGNRLGPALIATKDGQLITGFYFSPPDNDSRTIEYAETIANVVNDALMVMGSGWATWTDVASFPAGPYPAPEASHFPDPFSRAVDDVRRERFQAKGAHYENERVFFVSYLPPLQQVSKLTHLFFADGGRKNRRTREKIIAFFESKIFEMESKLAGMLGMRRMGEYPSHHPARAECKQDELVDYLNYCATGRTDGVVLPREGGFVDQFIGTQEMQPGENPTAGPDYIAAISIDGRPDESTANVLSGLNAMPFPYRFTQRVIYLDAEPAAKEVGKYRDNWGQQMRGIMERVMPSVEGSNVEGPINEFALGMKREANTAYSWAKGNFVRFGYYTATVILRHSDPEVLAGWTKKVTDTIAVCGYPSRVETTNTTAAWLGTLPGNIYSNVRRPLTHSRTLADLMPATGVWTGQETAPCPFYPSGSPALMWASTDGQIPLRINLHPGPASNNGHTLIFGPTDAGKSTLTNLIAAQSRRYPGMCITSYDYKNGMMATGLACGGTHFDLATHKSNDGMYCPHAVLDDHVDVDWAVNYDFDLYELQTGHQPDSDLKTAIYNAVCRLAEAPRHLRSMTNFRNALQNAHGRDVFDFYTSRGPAGTYLDGSDELIGSSTFSVYECQDLLSLGAHTSVPVLLHMFRRFERSLKGQPTILFIAEAHMALGHKLWCARLEKWLRTLRSKNCAIVLDTQNVGDTHKSGLLSLLSDSCPRKIFLPNPSAFNSTGLKETPGSYEYYKVMGLNDAQISLIQSAVPRQDYYFTGPDGCRLGSLGFTQFELAVLGATGETDVNTVKALYAEHDKDWLHYFMATKGISYGQPSRERAYA